MPPTILLSCESITKRFGVKPLFTDLSIALSEEDHVGLVGPNGSGKSTLLKVLAGLEEPDEGTRSDVICDATNPGIDRERNNVGGPVLK